MRDRSVTHPLSLGGSQKQFERGWEEENPCL